MKRKCLFRILLLLAVLCFLGVGTLLAINGWVKARANPWLLEVDSPMPEAVDCILVLGCGVRNSGEPSLMLQDRLEMGLQLYEAGAAPKLLMSGDHSRADYDEVNAMKDYVTERGVDTADVFMDHAGFSTYESMYRARDVFGVRRVIIVSQAYHLSRAVYDARMLGLEAWGVAAEDVPYLGQTVRDMREILARNKDFFYGMFQPLPTFLGDPIDITGDGNLSNG